MSALHPLLQRAFSLARPSPPPPSSGLEERVILGWKARLTLPEPLTDFRLALAFACILLFASAAYSFLAPPTDPFLILANSAVQSSLQP